MNDAILSTENMDCVLMMALDVLDSQQDKHMSTFIDIFTKCFAKLFFDFMLWYSFCLYNIWLINHHISLKQPYLSLFDVALDLLTRRSC